MSEDNRYRLTIDIETNGYMKGKNINGVVIIAIIFLGLRQDSAVNRLC